MKKNKKFTTTKPQESAGPAVMAAAAPTQQFKWSNTADLLTILFCCLYFIVEFIPNLGATD
ncbi:MAG: hypothetical protein ACK52X_02025, partial [bacterium]